MRLTRIIAILVLTVVSSIGCCRSGATDDVAHYTAVGSFVSQYDANASLKCAIENNSLFVTPVTAELSTASRTQAPTLHGTPSCGSKPQTEIATKATIQSTASSYLHYTSCTILLHNLRI